MKRGCFAGAHRALVASGLAAEPACWCPARGRPWWGWPLRGKPFGGLVRLSSAATAITTSTSSTSSIASSTISSGICSIGIESSPAGLDAAWVRIWFLDGVKWRERRTTILFLSTITPILFLLGWLSRCRMCSPTLKS